MILIAGATGLIGRAASEFLLDQGIAVRGLARDAEKAAGLREKGMEYFQGDMLDAADLAKATRGVTAALLVTPNGQRQLEMERNFARAAADAGVQHLVKISTIRATRDATATFPRAHFQSEEFIRSLGMRWTMLRSNFFFQNLLTYRTSIAKSGMFALPVGRIGIGMIDARDVAEMAARCLLDTDSKSAGHDVSGPELLDFYTVAERMSAVLGRKIRFVEQTPAEFRALLEQVIPNPWQVNALCELFSELANQALGPVTDDSARLLGRAPRRLESFVADYSGTLTA